MRPSALLTLLLLAAVPWPAVAQIYQPPAPRSMWDTWIFADNGEYQLFFLQSDPGQVWNTIGRAVSRDLVHWTTLPAIQTKGAPGTWDFEPTLTGITLKQGGRYVMFYGAATKQEQRIGVMFSPDLKAWTKHAGNPILVTRGPHYGGADWRDLFAWRPDPSGPWHAATCARTADGRSAIGHLRSPDLLEWEYLAPLYVNPEFSDMEVPEPFELNGRHYLLFSNVRSRKNMSGRKDAAGTYYVMSDRAEGPYRVTRDSLLLGSGNHRFDVYVGRTLKVGTERLLYSQTVGGTVSWATPKRIRQRSDGTLWLAYWPGLDRLITATALDKTNPEPGVQPVTVKDAMITVTIDQRGGKTARIGWAEGCEVVLDAAANLVRISQAGSPADEIEMPGLADQTHHVRLFLRARRAELYLDGRWLFNYRLKGAAAEGNLTLNGAARYRNLRVATIQPLP